MPDLPFRSHPAAGRALARLAATVVVILVAAAPRVGPAAAFSSTAAPEPPPVDRPPQYAFPRNHRRRG